MRKDQDCPTLQPMSDGDLRILVIDDDAIRASIIEEGLRDAGHQAVTILTEMRQLLRRVVEIDPEVIVIDLGKPEPRCAR